MARKADRPSWFKMFGHNKSTICALPDEAIGKGLKAAMEYFTTGEVQELDPMASVVFAMLKPSIDESIEDFEDITRKRKESAMKRWNKENTQECKAMQNDAKDTQECKSNQEHSKCAEAEAEAEVREAEEEDNFDSCESPTAPPKKPIKHKYGEYGNVLLTDEELDKLKTDYPDDWQDWIERLSSYMASTGKPYKSHYATIRNWAKKDAERGVQKKPEYKIVPDGYEDPLDGLF